MDLVQTLQQRSAAYTASQLIWVCPVGFTLQNSASTFNEGLSASVECLTQSMMQHCDVPQFMSLTDLTWVDMG